ncbi:MAG: DUF4157 domain-containing protein [Candidatus Cybelea sp.]
MGPCVLVAKKPLPYASVSGSHARGRQGWPIEAERGNPSRGPAPLPWYAQAKLQVGAAHDPLEHEADRVADHVMRTPSPKSAAEPVNDSFGSAPRATLTTDADRSELFRSPGRPLDVETRDFFEPRLGYDLSRVRVHADSSAAASARALDAQAYTVGTDVVFGENRYAPTTAEGKQLLAHELTHTVQQQRGGAQSKVQRKLEVGAGLTLDTRGYAVTKSGNVYTCPAIVKASIWHELFTSLLFSPRVFKISGSTNAEINANLDKHLAARFGIVDFASKKKYSFGAGSAFKMNPAFWIVDASGWRLKPGVDRQAAIQDLNVHPNEYAIACLAATQLTMEGGSKSPLETDFGAAPDDWIPGDWGYITNTNFPASGGSVGLEGENIIYNGKDLFWGHFGPGNEYKTLADWFDEVKSWDGGARTETHRQRPAVGLI